MNAELLIVSSTEELAAARRLATTVAGDLLGRDRSGDVALVVSELVTNALQHGNGDVLVEVLSDPSSVLVNVSCDADTLPQRSSTDVPGEQPEGRGLRIVHELADSVEVTSTDGRVAVACRFLA